MLLLFLLLLHLCEEIVVVYLGIDIFGHVDVVQADHVSNQLLLQVVLVVVLRLCVTLLVLSLK